MAERFHLDRLPVAIPKEQYERVADRIEETLLGLPGIIAVYGVGSVSAPGISDVDRIAVVEGSGPFPSPWAQLTDAERYVAMHTPFLIDVESFSKHRWFAHLEPLRLLHGESIKILEPAESHDLALVTGLQGLVLMQLRLSKACFLQRIGVRPMLCELHNLRHDLRLSGVDPALVSNAWAIASEVDRLRKTWWSTPATDYPRLMTTLVIRARDALEETLGHFRHHAQGPERDAFALRGYWDNVRLAAWPPAESGFGSLVPAVATNRWKRLSELRWRGSSHQVRVSADVIRLLSESRSARHTLLAERRCVVEHYRRFVSSHGSWSSIGFLGVE